MGAVAAKIGNTVLNDGGLSLLPQQSDRRYHSVDPGDWMPPVLRTNPVEMASGDQHEPLRALIHDPAQMARIVAIPRFRATSGPWGGKAASSLSSIHTPPYVTGATVQNACEITATAKTCISRG